MYIYLLILNEGKKAPLNFQGVSFIAPNLNMFTKSVGFSYPYVEEHPPILLTHHNQHFPNKFGNIPNNFASSCKTKSGPPIKLGKPNNVVL